MPGGLFQLTAIAKEDIYLNVNPQISFFRSVYNQYSNFSKITFNIELNNSTNDSSLFNKESISTLKIPDNGDLIKNFYINVTLPKIYCDFEKYADVRWTNDLPFKLIKHIQFSIGGRTIQEFDSEFLYTYYNITLNSEEYSNLKNLLSYNEIYKTPDSFSNNNYNTNKPTYATIINDSRFFLTSKYYKKGFFKDSIDITIPIPVWFDDCPFPIHALKYMDINVNITFRALNDLIIYQKKEINSQIPTKKIYDPPRTISENALLDVFIQGKSALFLDVFGKFNSDIYKITNNATRSNFTIPEYRDYNRDGWLGYNSDLPLSNNNRPGKLVSLENCYSITIPHFIDNTDKIFRKFNATITTVHDTTIDSYIISISSGSVLSVKDTGIGYYVPPPFDGNDNPTIFHDAYTIVNNDSNNTIENYIFDYDDINNNSLLSLQMKTLLKQIFPKITLYDSIGNVYDDIIRAKRMDIKGRIIQIEINTSSSSSDIINLNNLEPQFIRHSDLSNITYELIGPNYITSDISVEFILYNEPYILDDTVYRNGSTTHSYGTYDKFSPLLDIKIKNRGKYYIGSPNIYLHGPGSNFEPRIVYDVIGNSRYIKEVNINGKTPLGFTHKPIIKYKTDNPNTSEFDASLGVYVAWWNPFGLFRSTRDNYDNLPEFTNFNGEKKITNPHIYNDKEIIQTNLGKPSLNIISSTGSGAKFDVRIGKNSINSFEITYSGSGYITGPASIDYNSSLTEGEYININKIFASNGEITDIVFSNTGINVKIGDVLNIAGGNGDAFIKITDLKDGVIYDVEIINGGEYYNAPIDYELVNQLDGYGAIFGIESEQIYVNNILKYSVNNITIKNSGANYNGSDPVVFTVNHPLDYTGYGTLLQTDIVDGKITNIYPNNEFDRGYDYSIAPHIVIYGENAFLAEITEFDSNGGILKVNVESSFLWPKDIIDELFANITEDGNGNKYGDANLYDSLGNKYLNDFDIEYYFEILVKGPGKNARLAVKKSDFEPNGNKYCLKSVTVISPGSNYNNTTISVIADQISNPNANSASFNITVNAYGSISANIVNNGINYTIGDKFRIIGGKFNNNINTTTSYIEVVSIGSNGEIMSIIVDPGMGYHDNNQIGMRDYYFFYPRAILGINRIDVINGGNNLTDDPTVNINNTNNDPFNNNDMVDYSQYFELLVSDKSIIGPLEISEMYFPEKFNINNIDNFIISQNSGINLELKYYKSLTSDFNIIDGGYSYYINDVVKLYINHQFSGKDPLIVGSFIVKAINQFGNVTAVEPFDDGLLDLCSKNIELYEEYHTSSSHIIKNSSDRYNFYYGDNNRLHITNDNKVPTFTMEISGNGYISNLQLTNRGRNINVAPEYTLDNGLYSDIIGVDPSEFDASEKAELQEIIDNFQVPIIGIYDSINRNLSDIIIYLAKEYIYNPVITIQNLLDLDVKNNAIVETQQIKINNSKYVYKFNIVSGNGYRHPIESPVVYPSLITPRSRNAILETEILGSLHSIEIISGGSNFTSLDQFKWNDKDYPDIELSPVFYQGVITAISIIHSPTIYSEYIDIKIYHKDNLSSPVVVNSIMNYHLHHVNVLDGGYGYDSDKTCEYGKYIILDFDPPCHDKFDDSYNFYKCSAVAIIKDCSISRVLTLSGYYDTGSNDIPSSEDFEIQLAVEHTSSLEDGELGTKSLEKNIRWVQLDSVWYVTDLLLQFKLDDVIVNSNYFKQSLKGKKITDSQLIDILNTDVLFTEGKNLDISVKINDSIKSVEVDTSVLNTNSNLSDQIYIIDKNAYDIANVYEPIDIYDRVSLIHKDLVIAKLIPKKIESSKIYNVKSNLDNIEFFIKSISDSVGNYIQNPGYETRTKLRIRIDQDPELLAIIYPYFDFDYSNLSGAQDETYYSSLKAKFKEFEIINSDELFQLEGILGYTGGGLFDANIIMEAGQVEFITTGSSYELDKRPNYNIKPFYKHDIVNHYKPDYLEVNKVYNNNGFITGDTGNTSLDSSDGYQGTAFNNEVDNETGGIVLFNNYVNFLIGRDSSNIISNNFGASVNTQYTVLNDDNCESELALNYVIFENNYRGANFYSKPIITPDGSYNSDNNIEVNILPFKKLDNKDDYIDIFGKDINSYNQSVSIDYIFIEDKELKSILINEQQYFIPCYNKLSYHDIKEDIDINYESFGPTKDIIILPRRNDINIRNEYLNFTKLDSIDNIASTFEFSHNNYINNIIKNRQSLNSGNNFIDDYTNTQLASTFVNSLAQFVNTDAFSVTKTDYDLNLVSENNYIKNILVDQSLNADYINKLREYWKFRYFHEIPIINKDNYKDYNPGIINNIGFKFNNMIREELKSKYYFDQVQKYQYYNCNSENGIYLYNFSRSPNNYLPSGVCNLSHIRKVNINIGLNNSTDTLDYNYDILIYNRYYNILTVKSGIAELMFYK